MRTIDWDWPAQLEMCQSKIAELEKKIALQRQKIQRLLDQKMNAAHAQRLLAIREQSLERVQGHKYLIEIRIANRAADYAAGVGALPLDLQLR
jgi:TolA-binding protein